MTTQTIEKPNLAIPETRSASTGDYPRVQALLRSAGGGAWVREASLTLALAAQAHIRLDEAALIYSDVRDLMTLQRSLKAAQSAAERLRIRRALEQAGRAERA